MSHWVTIAVPTDDRDTAEWLASQLALFAHGRVVQVDHEPPQGALIVGDTHEDEPGE